jgi:hypothetical protein
VSFLAPWALAIGALAAAGVVLLHLVARQRPAAYLLPTTRFIPDRRTLVSRVATRPRDLLLLALRVLLVLAAAAAFARPVLAPRRAARARLVLLDQSASVADRRGALERVRAMSADGVPTRVIAFDSTATLLAEGGAALESLRGVDRPAARGSIGAALVAGRRAASALASRADSVDLVLVSPVARSELDAASDSVRAQWPGRLTLVGVPARADSLRTWTIERPLGADDPLLPAVSAVRVGASATAVRLRRAPLGAADTAFARGGGTVVQWDTSTVRQYAAAAVAMGDDVVVASLARGSLAPAGRVAADGSAAPSARVVARWADGAPAAVEQTVGAGCIRGVAIGVPSAGDLPLRPAFQRIARGLLAPCGVSAPTGLADSAALARLAGGAGRAAARGRDLAGTEREAPPLVPWLLGLALACALAEPVVRLRGDRAAPEPA